MQPRADTCGSLSIGAVARRSGLRVSAIRYYESLGLIPTARRVASKRVYDESVFESIALVRIAQEAGFTLAEVRTLVSGFDTATPASARWQTMARRKLADVEARIDQAERMKAMLEGLLRCRCETLDECVRRRNAALRAAGVASRALYGTAPVTPPRPRPATARAPRAPVVATGSSTTRTRP